VGAYIYIYTTFKKGSSEAQIAQKYFAKSGVNQICCVLSFNSKDTKQYKDINIVITIKCPSYAIILIAEIEQRME
jgi:hypothetical protein